MRAAIAWSYDLLSSDEQADFRRLSVFTGSCTLDAAEAVCRDGESAEGSGTGEGGVILPSVLDVVDSLVSKSLLWSEAGPGGAPRYRMLETVRQFGLERLAAVSRERSRHFRRFMPSRDNPAGLTDRSQLEERIAQSIAAGYE